MQVLNNETASYDNSCQDFINRRAVIDDDIMVRQTGSINAEGKQDCLGNNPGECIQRLLLRRHSF